MKYSRKALIKKKAYQQQKEIANERVGILLQQVRANPLGEFAPHYISLIEKICRRWRLGFPKQLEGKYCRDCKRYFIPGSNCSIRIREKRPYVICVCSSEWPLKQRLFKH